MGGGEESRQFIIQYEPLAQRVVNNINSIFNLRMKLFKGNTASLCEI